METQREDSQVSRTKLFRKVTEIKNIKGLQEYLDGLLLGDGSISIDRRNRTLSPCFEQDVKLACIEWLQKIKKDINKFGLKCWINGPYDRSTVKVRTRVHPFLLKMRERWYPDGKKRIPRDLIITPTILGNWYLGDGKLDKDDVIKIYTECFQFKEVDFLVSMLNETLGILSYVKENEKGNPIIKVRARESSTFLSYISQEFKLECFQYKFDIKRKHTRMKWLSPEDDLLRREYKDTLATKLGKKLGRSSSSIFHRANRLGLRKYHEP